ncbi:HopJ type III effector protein [Aquimarina sp. 2201CG14-23]|uniref:HopJ type III effector protein n=1 Tax=Aquimarina mycalae TaxID=3040073 RepID=UPI002477F778|nr:HopJ type III effector protein [Aquimarina sp. 2201CG14-23]MDH7446211.1 HopJ type III effector protein [Aquimarina sp. 2201CG14-23]
MTIPKFIHKLRDTPEEVTFQDTMQVIDVNYNFKSVSFINGEVTNDVGQNMGSCKLFSFAKIQNLNKEETLYCFGEHYKSVINTPEGNDHQNIRNFIKTGWEGISFEESPLVEK